MNRLTKSFIIYFAVVCQLSVGAICCSDARCEDQPRAMGDDLNDLSLEELMQVKVERVVTASLFSQRVTEAPASMTVITRDEILKYGYRTLADVLSSVPGLYVTYDRNYSYLGVGGFSRPGDFNSRILLQIDGHRLNDNIYDTAAIGTEFPLDIDLIDHIEFMRGPGSSLYGSNAFFGVINVITRKSADVGRELAVSVASFGTEAGRVSYTTTFGAAGDLLLSGTIYNSAGQSPLFFPEFAASPSGGQSYDSDYDRSKSAFARVNLGDFSLTGLFGTRTKGIPTGAYGTVFNNPNTYTTDARGYVDLNYHKRLSDTLQMAARVYYDHYGYNGQYIDDNGNNTKTGMPLPSTTNLDSALGNWWGAETAVTLSAFTDHNLTFGGEYRDYLAQNQWNANVNPAQIILDDHQHSVNWGLFLQDEYHVIEPLRINVGLRYDDFYNFKVLDPRAAIVYTPTATTALKLLYGEAFRAPNAYELYFQDGGATSVANPGLKPEKIRTVDAVWEQYFCENYRSSVSVFYYRVNDLISQTTNSSNLLIYENIDSAQAFGASLSLEGSWKNGVKSRLSYDWQRATNVSTGALLTNSPQHLVKGGITFPVYRQKLFVSPELQYTGPRLTLGGTTTNDPVTVNLTILARDLGLAGLDASASVYNLFDVRAQDVAGPDQGQQPILPPLLVIRQDGINFRFKLTYRF